MIRRHPVVLAGAVAALGLLVTAAPAGAGPVASVSTASVAASSPRAMCLAVDGQPNGICLGYPTVLDQVGDLLP